MAAEHRLSPALLLAAAFFAVVAGAVVLALEYAGGGRAPQALEFVSASSAARYSFDGATLALLSTHVPDLGPVAAPGESLVANLQYPLPLAPGAIAVAPPAPRWDLRDGAGRDLGTGRPLAPAPGGGVYALTPAGLVSIDSSGLSSPVVAGGSPDLVGALSADGAFLAIKNGATRFLDLYSLGPPVEYLGHLPVYDPIAAAFAEDGRLLTLAQGGAVSIFTFSQGGAPALVGTTTLPGDWP
jgi:hypothetical protein